jgi:hypothetical protein
MNVHPENHLKSFPCRVIRNFNLMPPPAASRRSQSVYERTTPATIKKPCPVEHGFFMDTLRRIICRIYRYLQLLLLCFLHLARIEFQSFILLRGDNLLCSSTDFVAVCHAGTFSSICRAAVFNFRKVPGRSFGYSLSS